MSGTVNFCIFRKKFL